MKMSEQTYKELKIAIDSIGGIISGASMRNRWDTLFACGFPVSRLYNEGLNDEHIETALRRMAHD